MGCSTDEVNAVLVFLPSCPEGRLQRCWSMEGASYEDKTRHAGSSRSSTWWSRTVTGVIGRQTSGKVVHSLPNEA